MDKDAALLIVAKDLFLAGYERYPKRIHKDLKRLEFMFEYNEEFLAFYKKLRLGLPM